MFIALTEYVYRCSYFLTHSMLIPYHLHFTFNIPVNTSSVSLTTYYVSNIPGDAASVSRIKLNSSRYPKSYRNNNKNKINIKYSRYLNA